MSETHLKGVSRIECDIPRLAVPLHEINGLGMQYLHSRNNRISRLNADRDAFKESTDTSKKATQNGCDLKPNKMVPKPAPMATNEDGQRQKPRTRGTSYPLDRRGCQNELRKNLHEDCNSGTFREQPEVCVG